MKLREPHYETIARYIALAEMIKSGQLDGVSNIRLADALGMHRANIGRNLKTLELSMPRVEGVKSKIIEYLNKEE